jgi:hypothetical protein
MKNPHYTLAIKFLLIDNKIEKEDSDGQFLLMNILLHRDFVFGHEQCVHS